MSEPVTMVFVPPPSDPQVRPATGWMVQADPESGEVWVSVRGELQAAAEADGVARWVVNDFCGGDRDVCLAPVAWVKGRWPTDDGGMADRFAQAALQRARQAQAAYDG
jgi:hypothetical protein